MTAPVLRSGVGTVLRQSLEGRRRELQGLLGWSLVQALPSLLSGRLIAEAVDQGFLAHRIGEGLEWLALLAASLLLGAWGRRQAYRRLAPIVEPFRDSLVTRAVRGALQDATTVGSKPDTGAVARLTRHIEIAREAYASVFMVVQGFVVTTVSALIGLLSLTPDVLVLVVPPLLAGLALFVVVLRRTADRRRDSLIAEEKIAEATAEFVGSIRDVVASGGEDLVAAQASASFEDQRRATVDVARFTAVQTVAIALGGWLPLVLILGFGSWLRSGGATTGVILGAVAYVLQGVQPALQSLIRGIGSNGMWLFVTLARITEVVSGSEASTRNPAAKRQILDRQQPGVQRPAIELRGVTFGYGPEPVVAGLDLTIPYDDHVAVVGPSGVGKSTLTLLISGLIHPNSGEALIDGQPLTDLDLSELAQLRVLNPQEAYVFSGTLWENLTYLRPEATESEVDRAVAALGIEDVVERFGGYRAEVSQSSLSAGERQLIALTRNYLSTARIVILDEATCHLDQSAEAQAERAFARRAGTLIVVAHRISSARRARRIVVMDGTTVVVGDHERLMIESALYRDLVGHWTAPDPVLTSFGRHPISAEPSGRGPERLNGRKWLNGRTVRMRSAAQRLGWPWRPKGLRRR